MKKYKKVKTAVIGCGAISKIYLQNLTSRFEIIEIAGCCDINQAAAEAAAAEYKINQLTLQEILEDPSIELVINLTNPAAHYEIIRQLLNHDKHVYTEKVLAADIEMAEALVKLAESRGKLLCSAPDTFLGAAVQTVRALVDSGLIGQVTSCAAVLQRDAGLLAEKFPYTAGPLGGIGIDVGIYYTTALINILGGIAEVCGMSGTLHPSQIHYFTANDNFGCPYTQESETYLAGTLRFESGCIGSIHFNARSIRTEKPYVALFGTEGILYLEDPNSFGGQVRLTIKGQNDTVVMPHTHGYSENDRGLGAAEMAWSIRKGRIPRTNARMALHALEILTGIIKSDKTKQFYQLKSGFQKLPAIPRGHPGAQYADNQPEMSLFL